MLLPIRVLDLADGWGAQCGRILADLGADVVKVEPPTGDPARRRPPFLDDEPGPDRSLWWVALNANKRGITLDVDTPEGYQLLLRLVDRATVLVEGFEPGRLDVAALRARNGDLVVTSVTPYGQDGPLVDAPASDLEVTAASGSLWLAGEPRKAPVRMTLPQAPLWSGMYAAMGTLLAYLARGRLGRGQQVDVSAQASMATVHAPAGLFWDFLREDHGRLGPYLLGRSRTGARFRNIWPCQDGHVAFAIQGGSIGRHTLRMLVQWMRGRGVEPALLGRIDPEAFDNTALSQEEVDALEAEVAAFLRTVTKAAFFAEVVERGMLGYPVSDARDIYDDPQLEARGFWQELPIDDRAVRFPGGFALFDGERPRVRHGAPRLGEHNREIYGEIGVEAQDLVSLRARGVV